MLFPHQMVRIELSARACRLLLDLAKEREVDMSKFKDELECLDFDYGLADFRGWVSEEGYLIADEIEKAGEDAFREGLCFFWLED